MAFVLSLRNACFTVLLAIAGALLLPAPSFASNTAPAAWTSESPGAMDHEGCPESETPATSTMPGGVRLDCCQWSSGIDSASRLFPNGSEPASPPAHALPAMRATSASAFYSPLHISAAGPDLIVLFGRSRK